MGAHAQSTGEPDGEPDAVAPPATVPREPAYCAARSSLAPTVTYVQTDVIEVRAWGRTVGAVTLDPSSGYYAFEYADAWRRSGIELSPLRLPNRAGVFVFPELAERTYSRLPAMLADSLPDRFGNALVTAKLVEEGIGSDSITPLDRLAYASDRAMGALEYAPPLESRGEHSTAIQLADLVVAARSTLRGNFTGDDTTLAAIAELIQVGTSAGGARAKAVICFNPVTGQVRSGQLAAPEGFEYWLIKLDGVDDLDRVDPSRGFGRVELAYSQMASAAGVTMSACRLLEENGRAHFMTRRFDRRANGAKSHLQSLCAMDHLDFNVPDTHSYAQYFDVIDRLGLGRDALEQAFRRCAFNVMAVNRDDHTKNVAFVCDASGDWSLAPAFDVIHSHNPQGAWSQRHQMSVNGKFEGIGRSDLLMVAERFKVPAATSVLGEVGAAVNRWPEFADECGVDEAHVIRIARDLEFFALSGD